MECPICFEEKNEFVNLYCLHGLRFDGHEKIAIEYRIKCPMCRRMTDFGFDARPFNPEDPEEMNETEDVEEEQEEEFVESIFMQMFVTEMNKNGAHQVFSNPMN